MVGQSPSSDIFHLSIFLASSLVVNAHHDIAFHDVVRTDLAMLLGTAVRTHLFTHQTFTLHKATLGYFQRNKIFRTQREQQERHRMFAHDEP
jgi:hypothetical protein